MSATPPHRREFVRTLVLGSSAGLALRGGSATLRADDAPEPKPPEDESPDPTEAEINARMNLIVARYGDRLDAEARETIRREVAGIVRRGQALRAYPLDNGDGPASVWTPYREPIAR